MSDAKAVRWVCALAALACSHGVSAAEVPLACERLFEIARAAREHRDQGYSLDQVLAGLRRPEIEQRLSPGDLDVLRRAVTAAFLGQLTPEEIALACTQARGRPGG
jgi:hypothetical protein